MRDKIFEIVKENGPLLPVEVASKADTNSFLANAYLEELVELKKIVASEEKVGSSRLFFVKGQEKTVKERVGELGGKIEKTAAAYKSKAVEETPELAKKRKDFADRLEKIESKEPVKKKRVVLEEKPKPEFEDMEEPSIKVIPKKPKLRAAKDFVKEKIKKSEPVADRDQSRLISVSLNYFREKGIETLDEPVEINSKESEVLARVPSAVGPVKFLVKIKTKKKINRSDLMQLHVESSQRNMPAMLLTDAQMTNTAKSYLREVGGVLRVKVF